MPLEHVKENFQRYGLLDEQVRFVKGWFRDTLPHVPIERLAVLRLDGDLYESTIQALDGLYHKLSPGGFVIVDDYGNVPACRQAVNDFRAHARHYRSDHAYRLGWRLLATVRLCHASRLTRAIIVNTACAGSSRVRLRESWDAPSVPL